MKKNSIKFITIIFSVLFTVIFFVGCGTPVFSQPLLPEAPFGTADFIRETKTYQIRIYGAFLRNEHGEIVRDEDGGAIEPILGNGEMVQKLEGFNYIANGQVENRIRLTTNFIVRWEDNALVNENRGAIDEITSTVTFMRNGFTPLRSRKDVNLGNRYNENGIFLFNNSYYFESDFITRTSRVRVRKNEHGEWINPEQTFTIPSGTVFCNEQFFILLRGFANLVPGGNVSFAIHHPLESYIRDSGANIGVIASSSSMVASMQVDPFLLDFTEDIESTKNDDAEEYTHRIPVMQVTASFGAGNNPSGPAHHIFMSRPDLRFSDMNIENNNIETSRLILWYGHQVFNPDGTFAYRVEHTLIEYESW
ncbi:MAG: hypothetical protein FWE13_00045 [Firmicutes bacterium]|nr:hypothetical protein [Bacillota bacterium]